MCIKFFFFVGLINCAEEGLILVEFLFFITGILGNYIWKCNFFFGINYGILLIIIFYVFSFF
jgi:hypothetical protein